MSNIIQIDNIGCLYTANEDGVQSYKNTTITIEDGLIRSIGEKMKINPLIVMVKWLPLVL